MTKKIFLKNGRDDSVKRFHPWVFSGAIQKADSGIKNGDLVNVYSSLGEFLGKGHFQQASIAVRILSFIDEEINDSFFAKRIEAAYKLRKKQSVFNDTTDVFRLVHGEGDSLPGLVIDVYGNLAVIQAHSVGMYISAKTIAKVLPNVCKGIKYIFNKSSATVPGIKVEDEWLTAQKDFPFVIHEYGNKFEIDPIEGQKTGFFIDQRESRHLVQKYSQNASVLNMFCYTGGFSVYALKGGATSVHSVDSSAKAMALTDRNINLNFDNTAPHKSVTADIFNFFKNDEDAMYDLIILDPPAFAKHRDAVKNALQAYMRINIKAIQKLNPGGVLFTFSCSQAISKQQFQQAVFSAAAITGKQVSILHHLNQPADHPVNIYHPEGDYLKGLVLYVR